MIFSKQQIELLAGNIAGFILTGNINEAFQTLKPFLDKKCSFPKLDLLGREIGEAGVNQPDKFFEAFDMIVDYKAMGGSVVVGQAMVPFLENRFEKAMQKNREYIVKGNKWYVCNIIGERSLGQALVNYFDKSLPWLEQFLKDENNWVKRSVGVAIHFFSKKVLDEPAKTQKLLSLIEPYVEEKQVDVVKGIGWGLKTIGKHHPRILTEFLKKQLKAKKKLSKLIVRKAVTYLSKNKKMELEKHVQNL